MIIQALDLIFVSIVHLLLKDKSSDEMDLIMMDEGDLSSPEDEDNDGNSEVEDGEIEGGKGMIMEESLESNKTKKKEKKILEMNPELSLAVISETKDRYEIFLRSLWADSVKTKPETTPENEFKYPKLDQDILWIINTEGCRYSIILDQFEDGDTWNSHPNILYYDRDITRRIKAGEDLSSSLYGIPFSLSLGYQDLFP